MRCFGCATTRGRSPPTTVRSPTGRRSRPRPGAPSDNGRSRCSDCVAIPKRSSRSRSCRPTTRSTSSARGPVRAPATCRARSGSSRSLASPEASTPREQIFWPVFCSTARAIPTKPARCSKRSSSAAAAPATRRPRSGGSAGRTTGRVASSGPCATSTG